MLSCLAATLFVFAPQATAQERRSAPVVLPDSGAQTHDGGFLRTGLSLGRMSTSRADSDVSFSGGGLLLTIAGGLAVVPDLVFYFELMRGGSVSESGDGDTSVFGGGLGIAYYVMPANICLSLSLPVSVLTIKYQGTSAKTDLALGGTASVGKEWWVSEQWGLGVAAQLQHSGGKIQGSTRWATTTLALMMSATYN